MTAPTWTTDVWATALLAAAVLTPDAPELPAAPLAMYRDEDDDLWMEQPDGSLSPASGPLAWAFPGTTGSYDRIAELFGPLREVKP